jgi:hypothetical protein
MDLVLDEPIRYRVMLADGGFSVHAADGSRGFRAPASTKGPKLYVYSRADHLIYIGVTTQGMGARLRHGMTANGAHGYHGYAWRRDGQPADLDVWLVKHADGSLIHEHALESVECEVVHAYRCRFGQWPAHQTEIHFRQIQPIHTRLAERIMDRYPAARPV